MWKKLPASQAGESVRKSDLKGFAPTEALLKLSLFTRRRIKSRKKHNLLKNSLLLQTGRDQDVLSVESVYVQTVNTGHVFSNGHVPLNGHVPGNGHVAHHTDLQTIYGTVQQVCICRWPTRPLSNTDLGMKYIHIVNKWNASFSFRFSPLPRLWQSLASLQIRYICLWTLPR